MCIKKQAEEFIEFCEERWGHILITDRYLKISLLYSFNLFSEIKNKDYSKLKEKIKKNLEIETKKYVISYKDGYVKISPKTEKIKPSKSSSLKEENYFLGSKRDLEEIFKYNWKEMFKGN